MIKSSKENDAIDSPYVCENCPDKGTIACTMCIIDK